MKETGRGWGTEDGMSAEYYKSGKELVKSTATRTRTPGRQSGEICIFRLDRL